jgi:hypothetical protein
MEITKEIFDQQRRPRYGKANPERMRLAFWEWMIRGDNSPQASEQGPLGEVGSKMRDGKLKSMYGPYRARDLFQVSLNLEDGPIWTFDRMGATRTLLVDGRLVCIGGEHEDYYDPDFRIYNDVVVFGSSDQIEIFGYPKEVFPPIDFHTATLTENRIITLGGLGYLDDRQTGHTPVYALEWPDFRISEVETWGENPGWIFKHAAHLDPGGTITIRGGQLFEANGCETRYRRNVEDYALNLKSGEWQRLSNRNWRQFSIRREDRGLFVLDHRPTEKALVPRGVKHTVVPTFDEDRIRFWVAGVPIDLTVNVTAIEGIVEGELSEELFVKIAEEIRSNVERTIRQRCLLAQLYP